MPQSIEALASVWKDHDEKARREQVAELLEIYQGTHDIQVEAMLETYFEHEQYKLVVPKMDKSLNLLQQATNELACIYSEPATRTIDGETDGLDPYLAMGSLDLALDRCARLLFVCRELFVRPMVDLPDDGGEGEIVLDVVTPDKVAVIWNASNPLRIDGILIEIDKVTGSAAQYLMWTATEHWVLDRAFTPVSEADPRYKDGSNPYGFIPYVPIHLTYPLQRGWNQQNSEPLQDATLRTAVRMTDHAHLEHMCSHKQLAIVGKLDGDPAKIALDPTVVITIDGKGNREAGASVLDFQADLLSHQESIMNGASAVMNLYGVRPEVTRGSLAAESGYALKIMLHSQERVWDQMRVVWSHWEQFIYRVAQRVYQADTGDSLPDGDLVVKYADIGPPPNPLEQAEECTALQDAGFSRRSAMRRVYGLSDEELDRIDEERQQEKKQAPNTDPNPTPPENKDNG